MQGLVTLVPFVGAGGLVIGLLVYLNLVRIPVKSPKMQAVADSIYEGAMAFLMREYRILAIFIIVVAALTAWQLGVPTAIAFLGGSLCSFCWCGWSRDRLIGLFESCSDSGQES